MTLRRHLTNPRVRSAARTSSAGDTNIRSSDVAAYNALFVSMALTMSWQLAFAVIVPIVGGYTLDGRLGTGPLLTLVGLLIACAGVVAVLHTTVHKANQKTMAVQSKDKK